MYLLTWGHINIHKSSHKDPCYNMYKNCRYMTRDVESNALNTNKTTNKQLILTTLFMTFNFRIAAWVLVWATKHFLNVSSSVEKAGLLYLKGIQIHLTKGIVLVGWFFYLVLVSLLSHSGRTKIMWLSDITYWYLIITSTITSQITCLQHCLHEINIIHTLQISHSLYFNFYRTEKNHFLLNTA